MRTLNIACETEYRRLDAFIAENSGLTRSHAQRLIEQGAVAIDGNIVLKSSSAVKQDSLVSVALPDEIALNVPAQDIPLDIVYQDADLAVINKQQGLTVHPANGINTDTLVNALLYRIKDLSGITAYCVRELYIDWIRTQAVCLSLPKTIRRMWNCSAKYSANNAAEFILRCSKA